MYINQAGQLVLQMGTEACGKGFCVKGAELSTKAAYGFGRYTFRVRMATTSANPSKAGKAVSGNISAAFSFVNDSEKEIDFELERYDSTRLTVGN